MLVKLKPEYREIGGWKHLAESASINLSKVLFVRPSAISNLFYSYGAWELPASAFDVVEPFADKQLEDYL